ncbi:response regulator [candidate division FCPU426 bacterium]|nr:response regulator [candidate division FCPU426 bacterium]
MKSINILLVDDNEENLDFVYQALTREEYHVFIARNGMEAISHLNDTTFQLVLTEIHVQTMDGIELLRIIQERWGKKLPVIFLANQIDVETTFTAIKEGARDLLLKPLQEEMLLEAVKYVLERKTAPSKDELNKMYQEKLRNSSSPQKLQKKVTDLMTLDEIARAIDASADITGICWSVMNMVQQFIEATRISIVAYHRTSNDPSFICSYSDEFGVREELTPVDDTIQTWIMQNKKELMITNAEKEAKYLGFSENQLKEGSLLAVPFKTKTRILGMIILYKNERAFFKSEFVRFISVLAQITAMAIETVELNHELKNYYTGTIRSLVATVEAKDTYTFGHSARVGRYALLLAKHLAFTAQDTRNLEYLALLHDIGKINVSESILRKRGPLTEEERNEMKLHSLVGSNIVQSLGFLPGGDKVILHVHEWYNGKGYPKGLGGNNIPLFSRIIAVADAFDGMISDSIHRDTQTPQEALIALEKQAGEQFDPMLVAAFIEAYKNDFK